MLFLSADAARLHTTLHAASFALRQTAFACVLRPTNHTCEALPATTKALHLLVSLGLWKIERQFILCVTEVAAISGEVGRACLTDHLVSVFAREVHAMPRGDSVAFVADVHLLVPPPFAGVADLYIFTSQRPPTLSTAQSSIGTQRLRESITAPYTSNRAASQNAMRVHFIVQPSSRVNSDLLREKRRASKLVLAALACEHWPYLLPDLHLIANCL
jgi:hypothetical protein